MTTRLFSFSEAASIVARSGTTNARLLVEARASTTGSRVFLSHSTKDNALVPGVVLLFRTHGASVYADDFDKRLPDPPNVQTAELLKGEIKKHPRFVVLATSNSHTSRWIPWELGLSDGYKGVPPSAILPMTPDGSIPEWYRTQYFHLYPKIVEVDGSWKVFDPRVNQHWSLSFWLNDC